jgi:hypothetical protein
MANSPIHFRRFPSSGSGKSFQQIQVRDHHECKKYRRLRPQEPEVWPGSDRPEFPALPDGRVYNPPQPDLNDKDLHLRSMAYFRLLCGAEAKEVILRTAEDVPGVYFIRPNVAVNAREWLEPHLLEHLQGIGSVLSSLAPFRPPTAPDEFRNIEDWYGKKLGRLSVSLQALLTPNGHFLAEKVDLWYSPMSFLFASLWICEFPRGKCPAVLCICESSRNRGSISCMQKGCQSSTGLDQPHFYLFSSCRYGVTWRVSSQLVIGNWVSTEYLIVDLSVTRSAYMLHFSGQPAGYGSVTRITDGAGYCPADRLKRLS